MKSRKLMVLLFLLVGLMCFAAKVTSCQEPNTQKKEVLTNNEIIQMTADGFSDAIITAKINQSSCNFDTSTAALRDLKAHKVSDTVISAMLNAPAQSSSNSSSATAPQPPAPPPPANLWDNQDPGIYLYQDGKLVEIDPTTYSGTKSNTLASTLTYGLAKIKMRATVRGASANTVVTQSRPEFYFIFDLSNENRGRMMAGMSMFGATSPAEFVLANMQKKESSRECVLGEFNAFVSNTGARDKDVRDFSFEKLAKGVFKVIPKTDLAPGEYTFYYAGTPAGYGFAGGKLFDFSVQLSGTATKK